MAYDELTLLSEYDELIAFSTNDAVEAVPSKLPVNDGAVMFVLTSNPNASEIDADTLPDTICDKFSPMIADAGISCNCEPSPVKLPEKPPVKLPVKLPVVYDPVNWLNELVVTRLSVL